MTMAQETALHKPLNAGEAKDYYRENLYSMSGGQELDQDLRRELEALARRAIERIVRANAEDYCRINNLMVVPQEVHHAIYTRSSLTYIRHVACLMKDLKLAASSDVSRFCKPVL